METEMIRLPDAYARYGSKETRWDGKEVGSTAEESTVGWKLSRFVAIPFGPTGSTRTWWWDGNSMDSNTGQARHVGFDDNHDNHGGMETRHRTVMESRKAPVEENMVGWKVVRPSEPSRLTLVPEKAWWDGNR